MAKWTFDPQITVDLLFEAREEEYQFQTVIYLHLFLIWCHRLKKKRKTPSMRADAAALALDLTFRGISKENRLQNTTSKNLKRFRSRSTKPWYFKVDALLISQVGGLTNANNAMSKSSHDRLRKENYVALKLNILMVELIAKTLSCDPNGWSRAGIKQLFQFDVFGKGPKFYRPIGEKRRAKAQRPLSAQNSSGVISESKFDELWDKSPDSIVLLYALDNIIGPEVDRLFRGRLLLSRLDNDDEFLERLKRALVLYWKISQAVKRALPAAKTAPRWQPIDLGHISLPDTLEAQGPTFDSHERLQFDHWMAQNPSPRQSTR